MRSSSSKVLLVMVVCALAAAACSSVTAPEQSADDSDVSQEPYDFDPYTSPTDSDLDLDRLERLGRGARMDDTCPPGAVDVAGPGQVAIDVLRRVGECVVSEVVLSDEAAADARIDSLRSEADVITASRVEEAFPTGGDDPDMSDQWHLQTCQQRSHTDRCNAKYDYTRDLSSVDTLWPAGAEVIIAVIDQGVDATHPDHDRGATLEGLGGIRKTDQSFDPQDVLTWGNGQSVTGGHGTHVAGIAAAEAGNGRAGRGLFPQAKILPIVGLGPSSSHPDTAGRVIVSIPYAITYSVSRGADVINMSLWSVDSPALEAAVRLALAHGVIVVAAAGNCGAERPDGYCTGPNGPGLNGPSHPAAYPGVISVANVGDDLQRSPSSSQNSTVDIAAPGSEITASLWPRTSGGKETVVKGGTSMAAPLVAATAAMLRALHPDATVDEIARALTESAEDDLLGPGQERNDAIGHGILFPVGAASRLTGIRGTAPRDEVPAEVISYSTDTLIVMDTSQSMEEPAGYGFTGDRKIDSAIQSAVKMVRLVDAQSDSNAVAGASGEHRLGVVEFSNDAFVVEPLTADTASVRDSLGALAPRSGTNIGAGLELAIDQLSASTVPAVMVLLSDGKTNDGLTASEILDTVTPRAASAGIKIFTVGFGESDALDESLLESIAERTGGEYIFAEAAIHLSQAFLEARASSLGDVSLSTTGAVAQSEVTRAGTIAVDEQKGQLEVALAWPGSDLDIVLTDPDGKVVDDAYEGAELYRTNPEVLIVNEPKDGEWQLDVEGIDVPGAAEDYAAVASTRGTAPPKSAGASWATAVAVVVGALVLGGMLLLVLVTRSRSRRRGDRRCTTCGSLAGPLAIACSACQAPVDGALLLMVVEGPDAGRQLQIRPGEDIGRVSATHLLTDPSVSARHAQVVWTDGQWAILDYASTAGTERNGELVERASLSLGDRVRLGDTTIVVAQTALSPVPVR